MELILLTIDNEPIFLERALKYLASAGKLEFVLDEIVRQHAIERELQSQDGFQIDADAIEQAVIDFRLNYDLTDPETFQAWLAEEGLNYSAFRQQIATYLKLKKLKTQIATPNLQEYFIDRKLFLDRVVLSRLVVEDRNLAEELKTQIIEEGANFEQLVREYSVADDRMVNGMMGAVSRGGLPDKLRAAVDSAQPGELIEPMEINDLWYLVRVEQFLPATFDEQLQQELEDELFDRWLESKIQEIDVKLQVKF